MSAVAAEARSPSASVARQLVGLVRPWRGTLALVVGLFVISAALEIVPPLLMREIVQLFSGTVLDNLTIFDEQIRREIVERAAHEIGAHRLIRPLPDGYDTLLSGSGRGQGVQLSAGQRQLLSLTRALIWDPSILLLDEATAAIDGTSDAAVWSGLRAGGRARDRDPHRRPPPGDRPRG